MDIYNLNDIKSTSHVNNAISTVKGAKLNSVKCECHFESCNGNIVIDVLVTNVFVQ